MQPSNVPSLLSPSLGSETATLTGRSRQRDTRAIDEAAKNFESLFVSLLLKQMRQSLEPGSMIPGDESDILGGLFDLTMGQHLAKTGALGIANMVRQQLTQRHNS